MKKLYYIIIILLASVICIVLSTKNSFSTTAKESDYKLNTLDTQYGYLVISPYHVKKEGEVKFPIYAQTDGFVTSTNVMVDFMDPLEGNVGCAGKDIEGNDICVKNIYIILTNKKECLEFYYTDVIEGLNIANVYKGHLIGYASSEANAKPKILKIC